MTLKEFLQKGTGESSCEVSLSRDALSNKLQEIVETEHNYVQDVRFLVESFLRPLCGMMPVEKVQSVFANAEQILELHVGIDSELRAQQHASPSELIQQISASFVKRIPFFKMYAHFCSNYVIASSKLRFIRATDDTVSEFLTKIESQYSTTLLALLIRPVQRICQYPLLFREVTNQLLANGQESVDAEAAAHVRACVMAREM